MNEFSKNNLDRVAEIGSGVRKQQSSYRAFGSFRFFLAFIVIFQHVGIIAPVGFRVPMTGTMAVMTFFALSGFILSEAAGVMYPARPIAFAVNRFLRIVPMYWVALLISVFIHILVLNRFPFIGQDPLIGKLSWDMLSFRNIISNAFAFTIAPKASYMFVPYIWAVRVEFIFYILVGFIIFACKFAQRKLVILFVTSISFIFFFLQFFHFAPSMFVFTPFFAFGTFCFFASKGNVAAFLTSICLYLLCLITAIYDVIPKASPVPLSSSELILHAVILGVLLAAIPILSAFRTTRSFISYDRRLGGLSYPIYVQQYSIIVAVHVFFPRGQLSLLLSFLAIIVMAVLTERLVDRMLLPIRDRIRGRKILNSD